MEKNGKELDSNNLDELDYLKMSYTNDLIKKMWEDCYPKLEDKSNINLTVEDITKIVNAFTDFNVTVEMVEEEIKLNFTSI